MTAFWVLMQKRQDGKVYADLHKVRGKIAQHHGSTTFPAPAGPAQMYVEGAE